MSIRLVILNASEAPETRNVALVRPCESSLPPRCPLEWTYACERDNWPDQWFPVTNPEHMRDVSDWGIEPHIIPGDECVRLWFGLALRADDRHHFDCTTHPIRAGEVLKNLLMFMAQPHDQADPEESA